MKNKVIAFITSKKTFKQTQKEKHSHSRWLECVQNMQNKKKTAWITPTNDEAKLKLSKQNVTAVKLLRQQQNKEENNNV